MNWDAIGAIGEVVGAAGVIVTLGFLTHQLRQNTKALRAESFRSVFDIGHSPTSKIIENAEVADIFVRGRASYVGLSPVEQTRFHYLMAQRLHGIQSMLLYHELNADDTIFGDMSHLMIARSVHDPGILEWWEMRGQNTFDGKFRDYIQSTVDAARG